MAKYPPVRSKCLQFAIVEYTQNIRFFGRNNDILKYLNYFLRLVDLANNIVNFYSIEEEI